MKLLACIALGAQLLVQNALGLPMVIYTAVHPTTGHIYHLLQNSDWVQAEATAVTMGGHLATINDAAENAWLSSLWGNGRHLWIGLNDATTEGSFVWSSGEPVTFTNWRTATGEPNDGVGWNRPSEDYVYMIALGGSQGSGEWNDVSNMAVFGYPEPLPFGVVEVVPEPSLVSLMALGALLGLTSARRHQKKTAV